MEYAQVRLLHIACAGLSVSLFLLRWSLALRGVTWRQWPVLRVLPHVNDAVLLGAAITLAAWSHQYPWEQLWLGAKVLLLLLYIVLGRVALRAALPTGLRWRWGLFALATVSCIILIAVFRGFAPSF